MKAKHYMFAATALAATIFVSGNLVMQKLLSGARVDFTQNNLYTLSQGTKDTLRGVAEPVEITFVYTRGVGQEYPAVRAYAARVRELLEAYRSQSHGQVIVREIDPSPFSESEDEALAAGITAVSTTGTDPLYFGIIGRNAIDDQRVIPFLAPEHEVTLEYDLTRMVARLDDPDPPRVGILSSLPGMTAPGGEGGYTLLSDIAKSFEIVPISEEFQSLPEDLDVLFLAHPPELAPRQEWLIDQYVLRHGRAVIMVDPAAKTAVGSSMFDRGNDHPRSDLGVLGKAWGVSLSEGAVADAANALPVPVDTGNGRTEELAHPLFIGAPSADMNRDDLVTADLTRTVNFGAPGAFVTGTLPDGVSFSPLIETGPSPSYMDAAKAVRDMTPGDVLKSYKTAPEPLVLAGRLSGPLVTAFPAGAPALDEPSDPTLADLMRAEAANAPPHISESETDAEIVLIADVDTIADDFYIVPGRGTVVADDGALVLNALDALSGGGELSRLRSRSPSLRPMTRIDKMRESAEAKYFRQQSELESRLETAQARLEELQEIGAADGFFSGDLEADLSDSERAELTKLRADIIELRGRLRGIERDYRREIDRLEGTLKVINIWGGPLFVGLIGLLVWRRQRHRQGRST
ncbi:GldG family protein [Hyphomonas oceanitis]|uniref:GldG family protein n=1 Tax=Hyphomonas oceanitis TaxID=81033 RepID=UPI003001699F